ncbi:endoplasmic reticulum resident protein 27 [Tachyglossus aculeatus]|uniref:endoplasmic reticulum resident protein 27 n=1 Tax=Tachyglossus aculeatus TaxID=9261 RepID=UPI0018F3BEF5|nr:endoplasmic reticulum resident protein 27 [Tachyglossus aculeatus]
MKRGFNPTSSYLGNGTTKSQAPERLGDVPATEAFIAAAEVAVIGFFQDLEGPAASEFLSMAQSIGDVSFALSSSAEVMAHHNITGNTISLFRLVDDKRLDLRVPDEQKIDATKMSRFVEMNKLHLVTEYSPMTAVGLFDSAIRTHLLLISDKASEGHADRVSVFREVAKAFRGKALFVLADGGAQANERLVGFFKLRRSQLPALAAYDTEDEAWDTLPLARITPGVVRDFCARFLRDRREGDDSGKDGSGDGGHLELDPGFSKGDDSGKDGSGDGGHLELDPGFSKEEL